MSHFDINRAAFITSHMEFIMLHFCWNFMNLRDFIVYWLLSSSIGLAILVHLFPKDTNATAFLGKWKWVIRFSLTNLCAFHLNPWLQFSGIKTFWQPTGSNSHRLSHHLGNDAEVCWSLLQSSITTMASSGLSVSPAEICRNFQREF